MSSTLLLVAALGAGPMTLERAEAYQVACKSAAVREKAEAAKELKAARMDLAKARRYGGDAYSQSERVAAATKRVKAAAKSTAATPILESTPAKGSIGALMTSESRVYRIVRHSGNRLELAPEMALNSTVVIRGVGEVDGGYRAIPDGIQFIIKSPAVATVREDAQEYRPAEVYEVTGFEGGKPVLEPFDVQAAKDILAKQKP